MALAAPFPALRDAELTAVIGSHDTITSLPCGICTSNDSGVSHAAGSIAEHRARAGDRAPVPGADR